AAAVVFVTVAVLTTGLAVDPTARLVGSLAWLVVPAGLGGYGAYILALRRLGATPTSMLLYLTPPVSAIWAWAMLGDRVGAPQLIAMGLGVVAVLLAADSGSFARRGDGAEPAHLSQVPQKVT
ncbi:DMT family transporter, partial [Dietzia sp. DQ11-38-2]